LRNETRKVDNCMKKEILKYLLILFVLITCTDCLQDASTKDKEDINKIVLKLRDKFPSFLMSSTSQKDCYRLVRDVYNGRDNFDVKLYSSNDQVKNVPEILVISNQLGKQYAIPLFSNAFTDFWDFQYEKFQPTVEIKNTFEKELLIALDSLHLNDSIGTGTEVIRDIFYSALQCYPLVECDFNLSELLVMADSSRQYWDCEDSCAFRFKKYYNEIKEFYSLPNKIHFAPVLKDNRRRKIYQLDFEFRRKIDSLDLKVFRVDCECNYTGPTM